MQHAWFAAAAVGLLTCALSRPALAQPEPPAPVHTESAPESAADATDPGPREGLRADEDNIDGIVEPPQLANLTPPSTEPTTAFGRMWDVVKVLPIFFYTPETSFGFGAGTLFQFRLPRAKGVRRPSSVALGGVYTLNKQALGQLTPELRFGDDRWVLKLDVLGANYPNRFYGIGNEPSDNRYDRYTDRYVRGELDVRMRPMRRGHPLEYLYIGAHYSAAWSELRDPRATGGRAVSMFAAVDDPGEGRLFASGIGPSVAWDSRDGINWPRGGSLVELRATAYEPLLGSQVGYRRLFLDARRYQPLWWGHILAMRMVSQTVWGEVPFQRLPQLGGPSIFRGWFSGALRGRSLIAVEAEYRIPIRERFAAVIFGSVGRVAAERRDLSLKDLHVAAGGGLRVSVDRKDRVNVRLDLAYGNAFYPYLQFREAF